MEDCVVQVQIAFSVFHFGLNRVEKIRSQLGLQQTLTSKSFQAMCPINY